MRTNNTPLSRNQADSMASLNGHVGKTVDVLTSEYTRGVNPAFVARAVGGFHNAAALRGLEARGFIRLEATFWRGASVTVLCAHDEELVGAKTAALELELEEVYEQGCAPTGWREALELELARRERVAHLDASERSGK